jgi:hypothetical protein
MLKLAARAWRRGSPFTNGLWYTKDGILQDNPIDDSMPFNPDRKQGIISYADNMDEIKTFVPAELYNTDMLAFGMFILKDPIPMSDNKGLFWGATKHNSILLCEQTYPDFTDFIHSVKLYNAFDAFGYFKLNNAVVVDKNKLVELFKEVK